MGTRRKGTTSMRSTSTMSLSLAVLFLATQHSTAQPSAQATIQDLLSQLSTASASASATASTGAPGPSTPSPAPGPAPSPAPVPSPQPPKPSPSPSPSPASSPTAGPSPTVVTPSPSVAPTPPKAASPSPAPAKAPSPVLPPAGPYAGPEGFIRVVGNNFVDANCRDFLPTGWNTWNDPEMFVAQRAAGGSTSDIQTLQNKINVAKESGFNTVRMFLVAPTNATALQSSPGKYNEATFVAFDYLLDLYSKNGIRVIAALANNWQPADGPVWYTEWAGVPVDKFWSDTRTRQFYRDHATTVLNRVNTRNGRMYKDDPTIFAWNLFNEWRCPQSQLPEGTQLQDCLRDIGAWVGEMTKHIKAAGAKQLVTTGIEGFFGPDSPYKADNPFGVPPNVRAGWPALLGQDFESQHKDVDFAVMHLWPDNWWSTDVAWARRWVESHIRAARGLGKPLIMEEFGKRAWFDPASLARERDPYFNMMYEVTETSIRNADVLRGSLFWHWDPFGAEPYGQEKDPLLDMPPSLNAVRNEHSTFQIIKKHAGVVGTLNGRPVPGCVPVGTPAAAGVFGR